MKVQRALAILLLTFILLIANVTTVFAVPPVPATFSGTVKIGGANVPAGTVVSARINGIQYAYTTAQTYLGDTVYSLDVPGDDPSSLGVIEGGVPGDTIVFYIGDLVAQQTGIWQSGEPAELHLTAVVNSAPVITEGPSTTLTMSEDGSPIPFSLTLHATDVDVSDTLTWSISTPASHGTAGVTGTGTSRPISYAPSANYFGADSFVVQVSDGNGGNDTITINVTISPVNDTPTTTGIANFALPENAPNTIIDLWPSFADIEDADGALTYTVVGNTNPAIFTSVTITGQNLVLDYVAFGAGTSNITVHAADTGNLFVETTFTVNVATNNLPPEITQGPSVSVTMSEDGAPTAFSLTLNATDADGDALTWSISTPATHGTATASGTGASKAIGYSPAANYNGSDTFVVQISDNRGGLDTINVNVTIQSINDLPVITEGVSVPRTMSEDGAPTAFSLTLNATDVDATAITWSISTAATHGTATASGTGNSKAIGYVPTANYSGADSFVVRISDGAGGTDTITVNVTITPVNDAPVAIPQAIVTTENTPKVITLTGSDVEGSALSFVVLSYPAHGGLSGVAPSITYTPTPGYNGSDSFTFRANDGLLNSTAATISITVSPLNNPPTNIALSNASINENRPAGTAIGNLTTTDPDTGDTFTYSFCGGANDASFQIVGAQLRSAVMFDYETKSSYSICIRSTDSATAQFDKTFTITINDLPDAGTFVDVPADHMFWRYIEGFYAAGITSGCSTSPMMFCPDQVVTRGQMAVFLEKALGNFAPTPSPTGMFNDVLVDDPFKPFIEEFYNDGITSGCANNPLRYCPNQAVTRGQMAVFIEKALGNFAPTPSPTNMFTDVAPDAFKPFIEEFYNDGITVGCTTNPLNYCPNNPVTRGQMAVFIAKAFNIPLP